MTTTDKTLDSNTFCDADGGYTMRTIERTALCGGQSYRSYHVGVSMNHMGLRTSFEFPLTTTNHVVWLQALLARVKPLVEAVDSDFKRSEYGKGSLTLGGVEQEEPDRNRSVAV